MKKLALFAAASSFALALAACGDSNDASEDALADDVELPADEAMANVPDPTADVDSEETQDEAVTQEAAENAAEMLEAEHAAQRLLGFRHAIRFGIHVLAVADQTFAANGDRPGFAVFLSDSLG